MAPSDGRREVPDSEDEPMTSSPVAIMDGAADKLFATARVPLQDAQDAPTEPARPHQANAGDVANVPGTRTDGLDVDQSNASSDVNAKIDHVIDMRSDNVASEEAHLSEANDATHGLNQQQTVPPLSDAVDMSLQSQLFTPAMTASKAQENSAEAQHAQNTAIIDQEKPLDVKNINEFKQSETADRTEHLPAPVAMRVTPPVDSDEEFSGYHHAGTHDISTHSPQVEDVQQTTLLPLPAIKSEVHGREASTSDAEQADPTTEMHGGSKERSDGADDSTGPRSRCQTPEKPASARNLTTDVERPVTIDDTPGITAMNSAFTSQEVPEAGGGTSGRNKNSENEVTITTPIHEHHAVNLATERHLKDNATASSSFASTASGASHPTSTHDTELHMPIEDTKPAMGLSPATTAPTMTSQPPDSPNVSAVAKTPQEITLAELKAQKAAMLASLATLPAIQVLMEENAASDAEGGSDDEPTESDIMKAANKIVKDHIKLLHEYNELKDVGQGLMGLIADQRAVRIVEVQEEFGIEAND